MFCEKKENKIKKKNTSILHKHESYRHAVCGYWFPKYIGINEAICGNFISQNGY